MPAPFLPLCQGYVEIAVVGVDMVKPSLRVNSEQMVDKNRDAGEDQKTPAPAKEVTYGSRGQELNFSLHISPLQ